MVILQLNALAVANVDMTTLCLNAKPVNWNPHTVKANNQHGTMTAPLASKK